MPAKGYRKREPLNRQVYVRYTDPEYAQLKADAAGRSMRISRLTREITAAYYKKQQPRLKQPKGPTDTVIRALNRIGNNLNQLARAANTPRQTVPETELRQHLASLQQTIARL